MPQESDFVPTMLAFLKWFFLTLDSRFTDELFAGRTVEEASEEVFADIAATVRGNRQPDLKVMVADYGAMMDRVAALHLRTRHGDDAVSDAVPF